MNTNHDKAPRTGLRTVAGAAAALALAGSLAACGPKNGKAPQPTKTASAAPGPKTSTAAPCSKYNFFDTVSEPAMAELLSTNNDVESQTKRVAAFQTEVGVINAAIQRLNAPDSAQYSVFTEAAYGTAPNGVKISQGIAGQEASSTTSSIVDVLNSVNGESYIFKTDAPKDKAISVADAVFGREQLEVGGTAIFFDYSAAC
jgi:hypothetical protein